MIHLDLETYSPVNLLKQGVYRYVEHPESRILVACWSFDDGPVHSWVAWRPKQDAPLLELISRIRSGEPITAHNAQFERLVTSSEMGRAIGFPETPHWQWRCSAVQAALHALPRALGDAAKALGTHPKDEAGKKVMLALTKPRTSGQYKGQPWEYHERPQDFETLLEYCKDDVRAEMALAKALPKIPDTEQKAWELDQLINDRGIEVDLELARLIIDAWARKKDALSEEMVRLIDCTPGQVKVITELLGLKDLTAGTIAKQLKKDSLTPVDRRVLEIRDEYRKTSVTKFNTLRKAVCKDGRLRGMFLFHGAQTGRWAGRIVQLHNLPRNCSKDPEADIARLKANPEFVTGDLAQQLIRPAFLGGEEGLLIGDYAGIELRVSLWLVDDGMGLSKLRGGIDMYVDMACFIYNLPPEKIDWKKRFVGKQAVLGLGYAMGAKRFVDYCAGFGEVLEFSEAKRAVDAYRDLYGLIVNAWKELEGAAIRAVRYPGRKVYVNCMDQRVYYLKAGRFLYCVLPSKRPIAYCDPDVVMEDTPWGGKRPALSYMSVDPYSQQWKRGTTFGGRLLENICQGTASCLLRNSLRECNDAGYNVVAHVHDEILSEGTEEQLPEFVELMERTPDWAYGLPVKVEAVHSMRYLKA